MVVMIKEKSMPQNDEPQEPITVESVPRWLAYLKRAYGISYAAMARELGVHRSWPSQLVREKDVPFARRDKAINENRLPEYRALILRFIEGRRTFRQEIEAPYDEIVLAENQMANGHYRDALSRFRDVLARVDDSSTRSYIYLQMSRCYLTLQRCSEASACLEQIPDHDRSLQWRSTEAAYYYACGDWDVAERKLNEVRHELDADETASNAYDLLNILMRLIGIRYYRGDYDEVPEDLWRALSLARSLGSSSRMCHLYRIHAYIDMDEGRWRSAWDHIERATAIAEGAGNVFHEALMYLTKADYYAERQEAGDAREGLNWLRVADEISEREGYRDFRVRAYALRGVFHIRLGDEKAADRWTAAALEMARSFQSMRIVEALTARAEVVATWDRENALVLLDEAETKAVQQQQHAKVKTVVRRRINL